MLLRFDPFQDLARQPLPLPGTRRQPAAMPMDAYRQGDTVHVWIDVPGVDEEDLDLTVEKNQLTVTAHRSWEPSEDMTVFAGERAQGTFMRTLQLGDNLDTEAVEARYENGVLHVSVPVADKAKPRKVEIGRTPSDGDGAIDVSS